MLAIAGLLPLPPRQGSGPSGGPGLNEGLMEVPDFLAFLPGRRQPFPILQRGRSQNHFYRNRGEAGSSDDLTGKSPSVRSFCAQAATQRGAPAASAANRHAVAVAVRSDRVILHHGP